MSNFGKVFYKKPTPQSLVKIDIVSKYFETWSQIMTNTKINNEIQGKIQPNHNPNIAYFDLFSGPGKYEDGTESIPIKVINFTIHNEKLRTRLVSVFMDEEEDYCQQLDKNLKTLDGYESLQHEPAIFCAEVYEDTVNELGFDRRLVPTLLFLDPWGYRGLSEELITSLLKDFGGDCIFFFNIRRMRGAINNQGVDEHVIALFTEEIALELRDELKVTSRDRDSVILKYLHKSLRKKYSTFILPFAFLDDYSNLSHYIVLATTSPKGIEVMKSIMSRHSTTDIDGVPSYTYDPRGQLSLLIGSDPIQKLADRILTNYKGELLTRDILYNDDHPKGPYLKKHYNAALKLLEENGDIEIISDSKRKPFTYAEGRVRIRVK